MDQPEQPARSKRTESIWREFDEDGELTSETLTVTFTRSPKAAAQPEPGGYL